MDRNKSEDVSYSIIVVALRKESVDRNINGNRNFTQKKHVALRKESVDRNSTGPANLTVSTSRSPQGERG